LPDITFYWLLHLLNAVILFTKGVKNHKNTKKNV